MAKVQSVEPNIADLGNGWLKEYKLNYKLEQESLNPEIDKALSDYYSKNGGVGGNRPDAKLLLVGSDGKQWPILIEYKGYKNKLVKFNKDGDIDNQNTKHEPNFKNINSFAVNGAVHYANALLHHTSYTDIIAVGMTGYKDAKGELHHEIGVYYVSKSNLGVGQEVGEFTDFSFLSSEYFEDFVRRVKKLSLSPEELHRLTVRREQEIEFSLTKLNNDIYQNEKGLGENDRVYLVAASIIATLGVPGEVSPLEKDDLKSNLNSGDETDGEILMTKIKKFLEKKELPKDKSDLIERTLSNTILMSNINKVENGESQLKRVFTKIVDDLGIYYKIGLTTDFTGKLFNEMYSWLGFSQDKLNDVVLTPSYVANFLVKLARVNRDSYVWDFATGSAGLLVAAMNEMLKDARENIKSPKELEQKEVKIKAEQLLGLELLPSVYMLAILNMILMGDGSSNIINKDSLVEYNGNYGFGNIDEKFPATAFVLNPPYSADGNGMIFVETALNKMKSGYAAVIVQDSIGKNGKEIRKKILESNSLIASIKMPVDVFIGKSGVQTSIYVFEVGTKHEAELPVKFIDLRNDGYKRASRKKTRSSNNLRDINNATGRYEEVVKLVRYGQSKLSILTDKEYIEDTISLSEERVGTDWNFEQHQVIDTTPTFEDFTKTVANYLSWEVTQLLQEQEVEKPKKS